MKLDFKTPNHYYITHKRAFSGTAISAETVVTCFNFSYEMVFGEGHHRRHRSGGNHNRDNGELFANTFQGKLAEFAVHKALSDNNITALDLPDLDIYGKGIWDDFDLCYKGKKITIKSAVFFSNLLLLEEKDWNKQGDYIPNIDTVATNNYDYFVLIRIQPDLKSILKKEDLFYTKKIDKQRLLKIIKKETWNYDFAGVCSHETVKHVIKNNYLLPQGSLLNGRTMMDASNYYIQCGDLKKLETLVSVLREI
ncbi:MAG: hypothetical protein JKY08_00570 [Flavobacteriaceae bacterium]|nr:hypothetical protein [Flavobacteriaceae bacterium]